MYNRSLHDLIPALDHKHKKKSESNGGERQLGLCRGVLCTRCNIVESKILRDFQSFAGITDEKVIYQWLLNLAKYYSTPTLRYIHPTEKEPTKILKKSEYDKLVKLYKQFNLK